MFVAISFQVWNIFLLQIYIFAELLPILWLWPLHGSFFGSRALLFPLWGYIKNYGQTEVQERKCIITCVYQFVFKFWAIGRLQIDIFAELFPILWFWPHPWGIFWLTGTIIHTLRLYKKWWAHEMLEMHYKMCVPICFQVLDNL